MRLGIASLPPLDHHYAVLAWFLSVMAGTIDPEAFMALAAGLLAQVQQEQQPQSQSTASNSTPAVPRATTSSNSQGNR